jgi:hypothetical protein
MVSRLFGRAGLNTVLLALALAGCASGGGQPQPVAAAALRDLADDEKKTIAAGVKVGMPGQGLQFQWAGFPKEPTEGVVYYCARVNAKPFVATVTVRNGKPVAAQLLAVGGREGGYVEQECRRHYANPFA